jgi:hypothetical protein
MVFQAGTEQHCCYRATADVNGKDLTAHTPSFINANPCLSRNGILHPISALGGGLQSSKYSIYVSGSNPPPALNSGISYHFWMDTDSNADAQKFAIYSLLA